jgi:hypothetical protein
MKLRDVPYWLADRDMPAAAHLLDHDVHLDVTETQEWTGWTPELGPTVPFNDRITYAMVLVYMEVGERAFPPVIMAPAELDRSGCPAYSNGWRQLTGGHRLRAARLAGLKHIPAYLVQP